LNSEPYITAEWKMVQARNFLSELLGLPISHFTIAFETANGDRGAVATSPRAIRELNALEITEEATRQMIRRADDHFRHLSDK